MTVLPPVQDIHSASGKPNRLQEGSQERRINPVNVFTIVFYNNLKTATWSSIWLSDPHNCRNKLTACSIVQLVMQKQATYVCRVPQSFHLSAISFTELSRSPTPFNSKEGNSAHQFSNSLMNWPPLRVTDYTMHAACDNDVFCPIHCAVEVAVWQQGQDSHYQRSLSPLCQAKSGVDGGDGTQQSSTHRLLFCSNQSIRS